MSDLALKLIAENRRSRAAFLDLGNCGLTAVPSEVGELVWVESLSLASEWSEWDGRAWQRKESRNAGDRNNRLIDIGPLGGLTRLRSKELADWGKPEDLVLRYRYAFLPKGIISRLTVRLHRFVCNPEMAWVTGVLFERERTALLVELLANGSEIELRTRGPERKALLSVIAADLDALNESFQGLSDKVDKRVPCNCKRCRAASVPEFFAQRSLLRRKDDNRLKVECPSSYEDVDVLELLDGVRVDKLPGWAKEEAPATPAGPIRIFLASSAELREDRDAFDLYFRQQNDQLRKRGLYLEIVRWENFLDAMSEARLQDEYNKKIRACDVFVCLFFTKTGKFTEEEFDIAHRQFKDSGKPRIYTFFKNVDIKTGSARKEDLTSLWAFQEKLDKLGHFRTVYDNIEHLKRQFRDQLDKMPEA